MPGYLLDTNSIIYFFNGEEKISRLVEKAKDKIFISFIAKIELLCFESEDEEVMKKIDEFLREIEVIAIDDEIIAQTIEYRRHMKLKVPDAIICATAKVRKLILVTADKSLTKKIKGIKVVSPL